MIWGLVVVVDIIKGQKSVLMQMVEEDLEKVHIWACDPLITQYYHKCLSEEVELLRKLIFSNDENIKVYTINTEDNITIGKLTIEVAEDNTANIDMLIGQKIYIGKGYGKDALKAVVKHCFEDLNLDSVKMVIKQGNMRAEYCCWACGMREDKFYIPEEENCDTFRMIIYKKDYTGY